MSTELSDFQKRVRETNKAATMALECAACVLRRAFELPMDQRREMLEQVKEWISLDKDEVFIPLPNDSPQQDH